MFRMVIVLWVSLLFGPAMGSEATVIAISSVPNSLNPLFSTDANAQNILRLVHRGLGDFDREMMFVCDLCENYKEVRSDVNSYRIDFKLRSGQKFANGNEVKSDDIVKVWRYYIDENNKSVFRHAFLKIKNIKVIDKYNFSLEYDNYYEDALSNLVLLKVFTLENNKMVEAGDFQVESQNDFEITLKSRKNNSQLVFKVVRDETTLALKLINKEIDVAFNSISSRKMDWLEKSKNQINVALAPSGNLQYLALNHQKFPMSDLKFRKVLNQSLGLDNLIKFRFKNYVEPANSLFSNAFPRLFQDNIEVHSINVEDAMKELGYSKNVKGNYANDKGELVLDWKVSNNRNAIEIAEIFRENLRKVGIQVKLYTQEWGTYMNSFRSGNYDVLMAQWVGFTGPEMLNFAFHSDSFPPKGGNRVYYKSSQVDQILDKAKNTLDNGTKTALYRQSSKLVAEDLAYIFLWHPKSIVLTNNCYQGLRPYPNGNFRSVVEVEKECE